MTAPEMRVAVAEWCGWNHVHYARDLSESVGHETFRGQPPGRRDYYDNVPDDLNACHDLEKMLTPEQQKLYVETLMQDKPTDGNYCNEYMWDAVFSFCTHATALQRCEALLRTVHPEKFV